MQAQSETDSINDHKYPKNSYTFKRLFDLTQLLSIPQKFLETKSFPKIRYLHSPYTPTIYSSLTVSPLPT